MNNNSKNNLSLNNVKLLIGNKVKSLLLNNYLLIQNKRLNIYLMNLLSHIYINIFNNINLNNIDILL